MRLPPDLHTPPTKRAPCCHGALDSWLDEVVSAIVVVAGLGQCRADLETEIVEIELLASRDVLTADLALGLFSGTGDVDGDGDRNLRMQHDWNGVQTERLDRRVQGDLATVDAEAVRGQGLGDVAGRDRTVEHAGLARLTQHHDRVAVQRLGDRIGLLLELEIAGLELGALRLEALPVL